MPSLHEYARSISEEVGQVIEKVDPHEIDEMLSQIATAGKMAFYAGGREGLVMKALAMRLFHLGFEVAVVGDMTAPHLGKGDLLLLSVGPGYISTVDALRKVAQRDGAKVIAFTAQRTGETSKQCDGVVLIPAQTMADDQGQQATSMLPMGSLYELALFELAEILVLELSKRTGRTLGQARDRHTNLE